MSSGVLNRQFNALAGRSRHALAAAASAAARHHGRTPSSSSIARISSSSVAGCLSDNTNGTANNNNNNNVASRNRFDPAAGDADYRQAAVGMGVDSPALNSSPSTCNGAIHGSSGAKRAASSFATSSPSGARRTASPTSSLLAPAASAYSSSSLVPSATNGGGGGGGGGATRVDAVVIGAGQAGLSVAYHLQKAGGLRVVALDANQVCMYPMKHTGARSWI